MQENGSGEGLLRVFWKRPSSSSWAIYPEELSVN
jgi:hypothetical protein